MKVISWNVNGLRAIYKKGFLAWLKKARAEIVCLQEIKAQPEQLPSSLLRPKDYFPYFNPAAKKGYSGVLAYTKKRPQAVEFSLGMERFDREGRILKLKYSDFTLINLYLPQGGRKKENMAYKLKVYRRLLESLKKIKNQKLLLVGDFNIAHREIDLARPKQNQNNTMFTPEERKQINRLIKLGLVDTFRKFNQKGGLYTWWPYWRKARQRNLGWRIDYVLASKKLTPKVKKAFILSDVQGSDHCPIGVEINN